MNFARRRFEVCYDPAKVSLEEILEVVRAQGFTASLTPPAVAPPAARAPTPEERGRLDVRVISRGKAIDLEEHLVPGKFTIVDYFADWCGPCKLLAADLERLLLARPDVAVRKVDLLDWSSAAAKQAKRDHGVEGIPYLRVYDPRGRFLGEVSGNRIFALEALLESAGR
jgi:thiol-disulfide isomerase/thioredoxin